MQNTSGILRGSVVWVEGVVHKELSLFIGMKLMFLKNVLG